jgi:TATA-box binding protein (TBP) (component of TFIID and TFIIIB)
MDEHQTNEQVRKVSNNKIVVSKYKQTFVASTKLNAKIDLWKASTTLTNAMYEPDQFPALIYCFRKPKVEIFLFESGKVVCNGAKEEEIFHAIKKLEDQFTSSLANNTH